MYKTFFDDLTLQSKIKHKLTIKDVFVQFWSKDDYVAPG